MDAHQKLGVGHGNDLDIDNHILRFQPQSSLFKTLIECVTKMSDNGMN